MGAEPNSDAFIRQLIRESPSLLAGAPDSIRDAVLEVVRGGDVGLLATRESLTGTWPSGPETAIRAAVAIWVDELIDHFAALYRPSAAGAWAAVGVSAAELGEMYEATATLRPDLPPESLTALVQAASEPGVA